MITITIAIINESSVITDAELAPICAAVQVQVSRDFAPAWGIDAILNFDRKDGAAPPAGAWWLVIADECAHAMALGYYDLTPEGLPLGKVFVRDDSQVISHSISREVLEMLADPDVSGLAHYASSARTLFLARDVCSPCGADLFGYKIEVDEYDGDETISTLVSDFVYPAWFHHYTFGRQPAIGQLYNHNDYLVNNGDRSIKCKKCRGFASASTLELFIQWMVKFDSHASDCTVKHQPIEEPAQDRGVSQSQFGGVGFPLEKTIRFDHCGRITAPFQFLEGCYIRAFDPQSGWRDIIDGQLNPPQDPRARAAIGSRRERRSLPRSQWRKSKGENVVEAADAMRQLIGQ